MWVRGESGAASVSFDNGSFGDFSDVGNLVRDVTLRIWCFPGEFRILRN